MNLGLIIIAIVIVAAGAFGSRVFISNNTTPEAVTSTPSTTSDPTTPPEPTEGPTIETAKPATNTPSPTVAPAPTTLGSTTDISWAYPGAHLESDGVMTSTDSTDTVTDWYKAKITGEDYNIRNFVKTSANDKVKNVLQAVRGSETIKIEITKNPEDSFCRIRIN